ncbi:MAG TPA: gas vesicle protein GvpG [Nitrososphaera sp.]|jgi:hypothetical protein|nr:gas vesicle protein GvpG [Nitrososphaera sp.]
MILELIIMKLTMDAIMQHCNTIAYEQQVREEANMLKARLLKLMTDYETGAIDQKTYAEQEAEIMSLLSKLTQRVGKPDDSPPSFNTGLGL